MRDILKVAIEGGTKTRIVYMTRINFKIFDKYAKILLRRQLLREEVKNRQIIYKTTKRGKEILRQIEEILESINESGDY